jgi:hypothetical protein
MNRASIPFYCEERGNCKQHTANLRALRLPGYVVGDVLDINTNGGLERGLRLTRRGYVRHPLFTCGGKRAPNRGWYNIEKNQIMTFQALLSGEAEERVAGVASPGEYSPLCNILRPL